MAPAQKSNTLVQDWVNNGFKGLIVCVVSMGIFVFNNLNKTLEQLNIEMKAMENRQVETDKRVTVIETARAIGMVGYEKVLSDVSEMKQTLAQLTMRVQVIAEFVSKAAKP